MTHITTKSYMAGAEPFEFTGGDAGVLVMHGFSGSCFEVRELGVMLHRAGYGVLGPALAGHGTHPNDLDAVSADDFFALADEAYEEASRRFRRLYVVGQSLGGTLGLYLASRHRFDGLITVAAPVYMAYPIQQGIPLAHRWSPWKNVVSNYAAWRGEVVGYRTTPLSSLMVFLDVIERVRQSLDWVQTPLLALHSERDETVPVSNASYIVAHVASATKRARIYRAGRHLMTLPPQLARIAPDILDFLGELEAGHARSVAPGKRASTYSEGAPTSGRRTW